MHHLAIALVSVVAALFGLHRPAILSQYVPGHIWLVTSGLEDAFNSTASTSTIDGPIPETVALKLDSLGEVTFASSLAVDISEALPSLSMLDEAVSTIAIQVDQTLGHNISVYNPWDHISSCQIPHSDTRPLIPLEAIILMLLLLAVGIIYVYTRLPPHARPGQRESYMHRADTEILKFITDMRSLKQSFKDGLDVLLMLADGQTNEIFRRFDQGGCVGSGSCQRSSGLGEQLTIWDELLLDLGKKDDLDGDAEYDSYASDIEESAMVAPLSITLAPHSETRMLDQVAELDDPARPGNLGPPFL